MPLTDAELAYMREVQAEHRPTTATLRRRTATRTATGGSTTGWEAPGDGEPVMVRISQAEDEIPEVLASQYAQEGLSKITLDLVSDVRSGDRLDVSAVEGYVLVTDGSNDAWDTAQVVWGRRDLFPAR